MKQSRRGFFKTTSAATAAVVISGGLAKKVLGVNVAPASPGPGNQWPGRIVINFNKNSVTGTGASGTASQTVITKMVDDAILLLTGAATVGAAWKMVFPSSLTAASKIALHAPVGFNTSKSAPNPYVVQGIVAGLLQMDFNGTKFPAANIYLYDMNGGGTFNAAGITAAITGIPSANMIKESGVGSYTDGANSKGYTKTLHDCDFLINIPSLRGHTDACSGGFTLGFKSHYGTYAPVHGSTGQGFLRDINCTGPVYNKTVLTVLSAIFGQNEGNGPGGSPDDFSTYAKTIDSSTTNGCPNTILMSTDAVSVDMQAVKIQRLNKSPAGAYTASAMPNYLKVSGGVDVSGVTPTLNIGTINESQMTIRRIINGTTMIRENFGTDHPLESAAFFVTPLRGQSNTFLEFALPSDFIGKQVAVEIFNLKGTLVRGLRHTVNGSVSHLSWDERDEGRSLVRPGTYLARLTAGGTRLDRQFQIMR